MQWIVCSDLESVFIPETWIKIAENVGIDELKLTTRDLPDYEALMKRRLEILKENNLKLSDLQGFIENEDPLLGASDFVDWIRSKTQLIVVSDIFKELVTPFMKKMGMPTLFCNNLEMRRGMLLGIS
jgi:phosphoserine/homoserine phosphotransferase